MKVIYLEEAVDRFIEQGANLDKDQIIYILNRLPYMEIVNCEDCKYKGKVGDLIVCRIHEISTRADDYCSCGERSEE